MPLHRSGCHLRCKLCVCAGTSHLVAYVTPKDADVDRALTDMRQSVPDYMVCTPPRQAVHLSFWYCMQSGCEQLLRAMNIRHNVSDLLCPWQLLAMLRAMRNVAKEMSQDALSC